MSTIVESIKCTACNLCSNVCPRKCITMKPLSDGTLIAVKDDETCIDCGLCEKICPSINHPTLNPVIEAYAAWSKDVIVFKNSASGGIAAELYRWALQEGWGIVGCKLDKDFVARYYMSEDANDIQFFQNSKYVYSNPDEIYKEIRMVVAEGKNVLFVGLPCHVAALDIFSRKYGFREKVLLVDIVCHGTPPSEYLVSHIKSVETKYNKSCDKVYFRDPRYGTDKFIFSLYSNGELVYKNPTRKDLYTYGYHHMLIYRECCFSCNYAKADRIGDLTLCDYSGLGTLASWDNKNRYISCILVNTDNGKKCINSVAEQLELYKRSKEEPLGADSMFHHPSKKKAKVEPFKEAYRRTHDYDEAARNVFGQMMKAGLRTHYNPINRIRPLIYRAIPGSLRKWLKRIVRR